MGDRGKGQLAKQESEEDKIKRLLLGIMEGYHDTVIPPLSYFSSNFPGISIIEMGSSSSRKRQKNKDSWPESSLNERKRREQMSEKYSVLQSMVPTLFNTFKPPKKQIIGDTVNYIKYLQEEKEMLERLNKVQLREPKVVLSKCTNPNSSVKVTASNGATFLGIQLPYRRGSVAKIMEVLEKHRAEVLEARVCVNDQRLLTFTSTIMLASGGGTTIDMIREEILTL